MFCLRRGSSIRLLLGWFLLLSILRIHELVISVLPSGTGSCTYRTRGDPFRLKWVRLSLNKHVSKFRTPSGPPRDAHTSSLVLRIRGGTPVWVVCQSSDRMQGQVNRSYRARSHSHNWQLLRFRGEHEKRSVLALKGHTPTKVH